MPKKFDLSLYLVLDANLCSTPEDMVSTALKAVDGGCTMVQLRAPEWKKKKILKAAFLLKEALKNRGVPLIINDHLDVALISGADGVHVGQDDIEPFYARAVLGEEAIIGLSVGDIEEAKSAGLESDYFGIGPVYSTTTKKDAGEAIGTQGLKEIVDFIKIPSVAIGGINAGNAADCIRAGADGVAVVSALCGASDPESAARELLDAVEKAGS